MTDDWKKRRTSCELTEEQIDAVIDYCDANEEEYDETKERRETAGYVDTGVWMLLEENARLRDATRWRSVGEELPEKDGCYFVHYQGNADAFTLAHYWRDVRLFEGLELDQPTHWQPLPEPPQ